jgi:hypothetical protein
VNLVVQSEDDHVVPLDEGQLLFIDGIVSNASPPAPASCSTT